MHSIWTSTTRGHGFQPPGPGYSINWDSPQASGLVFWLTPFDFTHATAYGVSAPVARDRVHNAPVDTSAITSGNINFDVLGGRQSFNGSSVDLRVDFNDAALDPVLDPVRGNSQALSISTWQTVTQTSSLIALVGRDNVGARIFQWRLSAGKPQAIFFATGAITTTASTDIRDGQAHHAAAAWDKAGTTHRVWVDGRREGATTSGTALTTGDGTITIGHGISGVTDLTDGGLHDVRLRDIALDDALAEHEYAYPYDLYWYPGARTYFIPAAAGGGATTDVPLTTFTVSPQAPTTLRSLISNVPTL